MMSDDDRNSYHSERARAELELAQRATCPDAARAHRRLATLHQEKSVAFAGDAAKLRQPA
jgi:hypothetical protein